MIRIVQRVSKTRLEFRRELLINIIDALREVSTPSTIPSGFGTDEGDPKKIHCYPKLGDAMRQRWWRDSQRCKHSCIFLGGRKGGGRERDTLKQGEAS